MSLINEESLIDTIEFKVEKIDKERTRTTLIGPVKEALVKWYGYDNSYDTWEPWLNGFVIMIPITYGSLFLLFSDMNRAIFFQKGLDVGSVFYDLELSLV